MSRTCRRRKLTGWSATTLAGPRWRSDLTLLNLISPGIDGLEVCGVIRQGVQTQTIATTS
jgi:CheY-like chemotaxis protein